MKALICGECMDIRALDPNPKISVVCRCGNASAHWVDPDKGTVRVEAKRRRNVRMLGMNNTFLLNGIRELNGDMRFWHELHLEATNAPGYIFDAKKRCCWACIVQVGETSDISWEETPNADASG